MTVRATSGAGAGERRMAGKAITFQVLMANDQFPGTDHQVGVNQGEERQHDQIGGQHECDGAVHRQLQNRKIPTCPGVGNTHQGGDVQAEGQKLAREKIGQRLAILWRDMEGANKV